MSADLPPGGRAYDPEAPVSVRHDRRRGTPVVPRAWWRNREDPNGWDVQDEEPWKYRGGVLGPLSRELAAQRAAGS